MTLARFARAVLAAYAQVLFSRSPVVGALLLAATLVAPAVGAAGLAGVALTTAMAWGLGLDAEALDRGTWGYNGLLVALVLGASWQPSVGLAALALILAPVVLLLHVALSGALALHLRLPALSLPFVGAGWLASAAAPHVRGLGAAVVYPGGEGATLLRSVGALFAVPQVAAGALVLLALAVHSRIALVCALVGWGAAAAADRWLLAFPPAQFEVSIGFNLVLTAVALGGVFYVPGWRSLLLGAVGALVAGLIGVASITLLAPVGLPVGALPFNATVLLVLYALALRPAGNGPVPVGVPSGTPEETLYRHRARAERGGVGLPLRLPVRGTWVCTQAWDGAQTHQGAWRHAVDLEAADRDGQTFSEPGTALSDYHCYQLPVLAPAAGTVVAVRDGAPDQAPGAMDTASPWGNTVVLAVGVDRYVQLSHLSPGSLRVVEGQVVAAGQEIGRCGSSGRAPAPHLHVQVQASPEVGAPTVAATFTELVVEGEGGLRVVRDRVPREGEAVRNLGVDAGLAAALSLPVGGRWWYRVEEDGRSRRVELRSEVDLLGRRVLVGDGGRLRFDPTGWSWLADEHEGPPRGLLHAWALALSRVPYDGADGLRWDDVAVSPRVTGSVGAWLLDAVAWLMPWRPLRLRFLQRRAGDAWEIVGVGGGGLHPEVRTEATLVAGVGVRRLEVAVAGRRVVVELEAGA
jgi:urea transporter/murein DD-endopeptidase MepM/ murein hydrolase activator NlpD